MSKRITKTFKRRLKKGKTVYLAGHLLLQEQCVITGEISFTDLSPKIGFEPSIDITVKFPKGVLPTDYLIALSPDQVYFVEKQAAEVLVLSLIGKSKQALKNAYDIINKYNLLHN